MGMGTSISYPKINFWDTDLHKSADFLLNPICISIHFCMNVLFVMCL